MRQRISANPLRNRDRLDGKKTLNQSHYNRLGKIYICAGIFSFLLGFLQLFLFDYTNKTFTALEYCGFLMIVTAAFTLGWGAHFIDKSDDEKRQIKKLKSNNSSETKSYN